MTTQRWIFCLLALLGVPLQSASPQDLAPILRPILEESDLPSLVGMVFSREEILGQGAVGLRKRGDPANVTIEDKFHLGSCTKSFTATLTAILVDRGVLTWETTVGEVLKRSVRGMHEAYESVTVEQLLAHTGGFATQPPSEAWGQAWKDQGRLKPEEQRERFVSRLLREKPAYSPGTRTEYTNQGYAVLGVMLEKLAKRPWEALIRREIFTPLGMKGAGFRSPDVDRKVKHPWGHRGAEPVVPGVRGDNPDAIAPAGAIHASLREWGLFAQWYLRGEPKPLLEHRETMARLRHRLDQSQPLAVGGWNLLERRHLGGECVQMIGSNTMWMAIMWIAPGKNRIVLVATNAAPESAFGSCDQAVSALFKAFP